jgi:hypothetical protein
MSGEEGGAPPGQTDVEAEAYESAMRRLFEIVQPILRRDPGERFPTRDELYDRPMRIFGER